jgi:hypothetical protein
MIPNGYNGNKWKKNVGCFQNLNNCQKNVLQLAKEKNTLGKSCVRVHEKNIGVSFFTN